MKEILPEVERWRQGGDEVAVATVVRPTARPHGRWAPSSRSPSRRHGGSVSGGCVEGAVYGEAQELFERRAEAPHYGISDDFASTSAWPAAASCVSGARPQLDRAARRLARARGAACSSPRGGRRRRREAARPRGRRADGDGPGRAVEQRRADPARAHRLLELEDGTLVFVGVVRAAAAARRLRRRGHRQAVCRGAILGWTAIVADARAKFATREADAVGPGDHRRLARRGARAGRARPPDGDRRADPRPQVRRPGDRERARGGASYVGALGSRRTQERGASACRGRRRRGRPRPHHGPSASTSAPTRRRRRRSRSSPRSSPRGPSRGRPAEGGEAAHPRRGRVAFRASPGSPSRRSRGCGWRTSIPSRSTAPACAATGASTS